MFLGLDISKGYAAFAFTTDGEKFDCGEVQLRDFQKFLTEHKAIKALALEYTGRLAEPFIEICIEEAVPVYIIHTAERNALTRLQRRKKGDTDKRAAQSIARALLNWITPSQRAALCLPSDMFTDASTVRVVWQLRAQLSCVDTLTQERTKAKQRASAASASGNTDLAEFWLLQAESTTPETALKKAVAFAQKHHPEHLQNLLSLPGVGERTATYAIATLLPIDRFNTVKQVISYVGIDPKVHQSGGKELSNRRISHRGQKELRALLHMAALTQIKADNPFGEFYRQLMARGKHHNTALVALSAKILRAITAVLLRGSSKEQAIKQAEEALRPQIPANAHTQAQTARLLGVSRQAINQRIKTGTLSTVTIEGKTYVLDTAPPSQVEEAIEAQLLASALNDAIPLFEQTPAGLQTVIPT